MKIQIKIVFYSLMVLASSSQQTNDQSTTPVLVPILTQAAFETTQSSLLLDAGDEVLEPKPRSTNQNPTGPDGNPIKTAATGRDELVQSVSMSVGSRSDMAITPRITTPVLSVNTISPSQLPGPQNAATDSLSAPPTPRSSTPSSLSSSPGVATFPGRDFVAAPGSPATRTSLPSLDQSAAAESPTWSGTRVPIPSRTPAPSAGHTRTSSPAQQPTGPVQSELNVGDEDSTPHRSSSPLDPLLAGLVSVFILTTAIVSVVLFLKFRQRIDHPEFHQLQDLPMDDLMEDTPLSRFSY